MTEFLSSRLAVGVILLAVLAVMVAVGVYAIAKSRAEVNRTEPAASQWLTNFEELHVEGVLSDEEYRTIKAMLAERLQRELNGTDEPR